MAFYTNRQSLQVTFGEDEADGLAEDEQRLDKAAKEAYDDINTYLRSSGYIVPLLFTPFGEVVEVDDPPLLDGRIQAVSDGFTAFNLARHTDLNKKVYDAARVDGLKWLEQVRLAEIRLDLPKTPTPTGSGEAVTIARTSVFNRMLRREQDVFGNSRG